MRCEWAYAERAGKHHNINRYRSLAKGSGFKINEVMGDGKEDAFSVVDYGAPIVNIGIGSTGAPVVACARYLGILHFRNTLFADDCRGGRL